MSIAGSILLGIIALVVVIGLVAVAVYQARTGKSILGSMLPTGAKGKTPSWVKGLLGLVGFLVIISLWGPFADGAARWFADSDAGRSFGADYDTVRLWLWLPFVILLLGALVALIGSKQMGTYLGGTFTVVSIGVIAALFIGGIYEERGNGCGGLSELASGPGDIVEINTFTVLTVTVCRGDPRVTLLMENDLPPVITFAGDQAQIDALTRRGIQPSWFAVAQNVPGRMDLYWFNTLNSGFDATQSDRITLIISSM